MTASSTPHASPRRPQSAPSTPLAALAFVVDAALVVVFAGLGRSSHAREATVLGLVETAWPFLAGLAVLWLVCRAWRRPFAPLRTGAPLWVGTVVVGMLLRLVTGAGTALPFVLVATGSLAVLLIGWRGVAALVLRARPTR